MHNSKAIVALIIDIVAVFRLTRLITRDRITDDFRNKIGEKFGMKSKYTYMVNCDWCISMWAAAIIFTARKTHPDIADWLSGLLTASAVVGIAADKGL